MHTINPVKKNDALLRGLLNPTVPTIMQEAELVESSSSMVESILGNNTAVVYEQTKTQLNALYDGLKHVFEVAAVPVELRKLQFLNKTGLAMSPENAITTINDVYRVSGFIRAIALAIDDLKAEFADEPLHIVYPACGPLAPLLMPLLAYYKSTGKYDADDLSVTLIDVQQGAVLSLQALFHGSSLGCYIREIVYGDAVDYQKKPDDKIHMVVLEAMQHGFSTEGQLAIAMHFAGLIEDKGLFLPEKISIEAVLASGQREFNDQWQDQAFTQSGSMNEDILKERVKLGTVLDVTMTNIKKFEIQQIDEYTRLVRCAVLKIPDFAPSDEQKILLFCSRVEIYKGEVVDEYDSGITHPLPDLSICINFVPKHDLKEDDLLVKSGDTLAFYYRLNGLPGFLVTKG